MIATRSSDVTRLASPNFLRLRGSGRQFIFSQSGMLPQTSHAPQVCPLGSLPEVIADFFVAAIVRLHKSADGVIALPGAVALGGVGDLVGEKSEQAGVLFLPEHDAVGGLAIASGASGFLVILLDGFRQREMNDGADGGLINSQPKGNGADQHAHFVGHPALLIAAAVVRVHFAVVADGGDALVLEKIHRLFYAIDGGRINNDVAVGIIAQDFEEKRKLLDALARANQIAKIRAVKAGDVFIRLRRCSWVRMSARTCFVALAVKAAIGRSGKRSRRRLSWRYSGRNSCPHSEMQWASSMAKNAMGTCWSQCNVSARARRSGER